ncbi:MAG: endonuclease/exonuclease/phosphatase family protein [Patescibacteria group bacterium]
MQLSILQLNINADNFWDRLTAFLKTQNFDILQLQEVTGKDLIGGNMNTKIDCYQELQALLSSRYESAMAITEWFSSSPQTAYFGNATFYKKDFTLVEKTIVPLHKRQAPFPSDAKTFEDVSKSILHVTLTINGKNISFLNTHLAWGPTPEEHPHQTEQGEKLIEYLKAVPSPFIFTGDFNLDPNQPTIHRIETIARNLTRENNITNTLNPRLHKVKHLFPPGVAVDYIFVSPDIEVKDFTVLEEDLSDHLGLTATIEV